MIPIKLMAMGADYYAEKESAEASAAVCASFVATARSTSAWETVRGTTTLAPRGDGSSVERVATAENGWRVVVVSGRVGWVSGKYAKLA